MDLNNSTKTMTVINQTEAQERQHLQHIAGKIAAELSTFCARMSAHHGEAREIIDGLQENKRDMDHAEKVNMRQSVNVMKRINEHGVAQQRRLERLLNSPYFGRINIDSAGEDDSGDDIRPVYFGIHSFYDAASRAPHTAEIDRHMLYIACTRAMHRLSLTCSGRLTAFLDAAVEQSLVTEQSCA